MKLLKDELMGATGLSEAQLKQRLLKKASEIGLRKARQDVENNAFVEDSWAFLTTCYTPSDSTLRDRMLKAVK